MTTITETQQTPQLRDVMQGAFRANPDYQLVPFEQLPAEQRGLLGSLARDPELYGILTPREGVRLPLKSVCRQTARLFLALQETGCLPAFVRTEPAAEANHAIVELVLDSVLQLVHKGRVLQGPAALAAVSITTHHPDALSGTALLSREALLYAQSLPFTEATALSARLYSYGRLPATPSWKRRFPDEQAVRRCLGVDDSGRNLPRLADGWQLLPPDPENDGWLFWRSRTAASAGRMAACKLYLSPHPAYLAEAFDAMIPALEAGGANAFKVGKDISGILRADKIIAYFSQIEQLQDAADRILQRLSGCPAQGVPFTAELKSPLLSWGADPPVEKDVPPWLARQSWRLWITNRLAVALIAAKQGPVSGTTQPWQFALDRLRLEGVDTNTWSPLRKEGN